jgi:lipid II:glycine glycyltransferase (peptidoglycan interpeptide bridge formation enzyme)
MWSVLHKAGIAHLLTAKYEGEIITTWVLFKFGDTLYYPYGASTREHREVMANNLVMWEAIKLAKKWGCKYLDMWGALGADPDPKDPWFGFHTFKSGYNGRAVEYIGTWDWVAKPVLYRIYRIVENWRWRLLRILK